MEALDGGSAGFYGRLDRRPSESHTPEKSVLRMEALAQGLFLFCRSNIIRRQSLSAAEEKESA